MQNSYSIVPPSLYLSIYGYKYININNRARLTTEAQCDPPTQDRSTCSPLLLRTEILTPSQDKVEEHVLYHRRLSIFSPLLLSPTHELYVFIIFFLMYFFFRFLPLTRVYLQSFLFPRKRPADVFYFSLARQTWPPSRKSQVFSSRFRASCKEFVSHGHGHSPRCSPFHALFIYLSLIKYRSQEHKGCANRRRECRIRGDLAQGKWPTTFN